jgi:hypothetical protein
MIFKAASIYRAQVITANTKGFGCSFLHCPYGLPSDLSDRHSSAKLHYCQKTEGCLDCAGHSEGAATNSVPAIRNTLFAEIPSFTITFARLLWLSGSFSKFEPVVVGSNPEFSGRLV